MPVILLNIGGLFCASMVDHASVPLGSYMVLRASDGLRPVSNSGQEPLTVVLLHGWIQDKGAWLPFAEKLRDQHYADVLVLDFFGHGSSMPLRHVSLHNIPVLVSQVRRLVEHLGWQDRMMVVGGISMGASVAMAYATKFAECIAGLLLLAPSGLPEPNPIPHTVAFLARTLLADGKEDADCRAMSSESSLMLLRQRLLAKFNYLKTSPAYGHDMGTFDIIRHHGWPVTVVLGTRDFIHIPQPKEWRKRIPWARIKMVSATHMWLCTFTDSIDLENDRLWTEARTRHGCKGVHGISAQMGEVEDRVVRLAVAKTATTPMSKL